MPVCHLHLHQIRKNWFTITCVLRWTVSHHQRLDDFLVRRASWSHGSGAPFICYSSCLAGESLLSCTKPIWAQLVSSSCQLKWSFGSLMHHSVPFLSSDLQFYTNCNVSVFLPSLYIQDRFPVTLYLSSDWISWIKHTEEGNYSEISEIHHPWPNTEIKSYLFFLLRELWNQFVLGLVLTASFPPLSMVNGYVWMAWIIIQDTTEINEFNILAWSSCSKLGQGWKWPAENHLPSIKMQHKRAVL